MFLHNIVFLSWNLIATLLLASFGSMVRSGLERVVNLTVLYIKLLIIGLASGGSDMGDALRNWAGVAIGLYAVQMLRLRRNRQFYPVRQATQAH